VAAILSANRGGGTRTQAQTRYLMEVGKKFPRDFWDSRTCSVVTGTPISCLCVAEKSGVLSLSQYQIVFWYSHSFPHDAGIFFSCNMSALTSMTELWPYLKPFVTLSYPTERPKNPDSFPNANYYNVGWLDICMIITCIAVMAILRDAFRLGIFEPFAHWKLTRDLRLRKARQAASLEKEKTNGHSNGHANGKTNGHVTNGDAVSLQPTIKERKQIHRSVLRYAEQGWSVVYYPTQWCFGLVNIHPCMLFLTCH
jgi:hypothetical protein